MSSHISYVGIISVLYRDIRCVSIMSPFPVFFSILDAFSPQVLVTSSTLDGSLRELQAQEGDEDTARQLSACSAWIQQEEEDDGDLASEFLFSQVLCDVL